MGCRFLPCLIFLVEVCLAYTQDADILFLVTGKLQGLFMPVTDSGSACDPLESAECFGGHARRLAYYRAKQEELAGSNTTLVLLDAGGDAFGGPLYGHPDYDLGFPSMTLSNLMPYDICTFAPHDFLCKSDSASLLHGAESYSKRTCPLVLSNGDFNAPFEAVNDRLHRYIVKEFDNGVKIAFFGMFPRIDEIGFSYGPEVIDLDPNSRHSQILQGTLYDLEVNVTEYEAALAESKYTTSQLSEYFGDVYRLATEAPLDLLLAASEAQADHPDLAAMVLIMGNAERQDQLDWIQKYGPFDIVIVAEKEPSADDYSEVISLYNKKVVRVFAHGIEGFTSLRATINKGGVQSFEYTPSLVLNSSVPSDATVQAKLSEFYQYIRERNAVPFGSVTNPILGAHRVDEEPPSMYQCYYMDCSGGDVLGKALLSHAFSQGFEADISLYNLGGFRAILAGDDQGRVSISHCTRTFQFQNMLKLWTITGKDLYDGLKNLMAVGERGIMAGGVRIAIHEPCWDFVDHENFQRSAKEAVAPGSEEELAACQAAGIEPDLQIIDVQVYVRNEDLCTSSEPCQERVWETLEKGRTYTMVSSEYLSTVISGFVATSVSLSADDEALCQYVAEQGVVQVEPWTTYLARGLVQYATPAEGWAAGNRIPSVVAQESVVENAALCPAGKWLPERGTECIDCGVGTRSTEDSSSCVDCDVGFYGNTTGLATCTRCPAGRFSGEVGSTTCLACPAGTYSELAASSCYYCKPGFYSPKEEAAVCTVCAQGTFTNQSGASACHSCGSGLITKVVTATSEEDCVCPAGTYRNQARMCETCPEGFVCEVASDVKNLDSLSDPRPLALAGYMTRVEEPLKAWRCLESGRCPGGYPSTCEVGRDSSSIACGLCQADRYDAGIQCEMCGSWSTPGIVLAIVAGVILLIAMTFMTSADLHRRSRLSSFIVIAIGVVLTATQTIGVFNDLTVEWVEPLDSIFGIAALMTVDLKVVRTQCWFGQGPIITFAIRQFSPFVCGPIMTLVFYIRARFGRLVNVRVESCNAFGTILNAFYIGLLKSCLSPFICYEHPENHGASIIEYPSVLCWEEEGTSLTLAGLSVTGFLCIPLPFTVFAVYSCFRHKALLLDSSVASFRMLQTSRFLWFRFSHECYYYGLLQLLRNFLLSIVPIFAAYDPVVQIGCMALIIIVFLVLQAYLQPWRTFEANLFDTGTAATILGALVCAAMASDLQAYQSSFTSMAIIVVFFFVSLLLGAMGYVVVHTFSARRAKFDFFLCHHKSHAGAQARLMKALLKSKGKRVFIDSDDLRDLDSLFDTVKFNVKHLLVYLTGQTLNRPWCAGEIFSAHRCAVPLIAVRTAAFKEPSLQALRRVQAILDESACSLSDYKITYEDISEAYRQLLGPSVINYELDKEVTASRRMPRLVAELVSTHGPSGHDSGMHEAAPLKRQEGMLVVSCDPHDDEAVAAAEVLLVLLSATVHESDRNVCRLFDYPVESDIHKFVVAEACAIIIFLSRNTLRCRTQVSVLYDAMVRKAAGFEEVLPVSTPGFEFPIRDLSKEDFLPVETVEDVREMIRGAFRLVAVIFPTHASEYVLQGQSREIWNRLFPKRLQKTNRNSRMWGDTSSSDIASAPVEEEKDEETSKSTSLPIFRMAGVQATRSNLAMDNSKVSEGGLRSMSQGSNSVAQEISLENSQSQNSPQKPQCSPIGKIPESSGHHDHELFAHLKLAQEVPLSRPPAHEASDEDHSEGDYGFLREI